MKVKYTIMVIAAAVVLVAAAILVVTMPAPDDRTVSERLILTASDLTGMNATQHSEPFPSPYHPALHLGGSEAAESGFSLTVDGWFLDVACVLVVYNSSSLASQAVLDMGLDENYSEMNVGDKCLAGGYYNETYGTPYVIRSNISAVLLENDTITYFIFRTYPVNGSGEVLSADPGTFSLQNIEGILKAQSDKVKLGA
ncbi:MAG: hypothetical protein ISF22_05385 [Methanomassiliicoccus sp.]|nr:hypothetical protein [Methanomassiliicoccus sp.]